MSSNNRSSDIAKSKFSKWIMAAASVLLLVLVVTNTKIVSKADHMESLAGGFNPAEFAAEYYEPRIRPWIVENQQPLVDLLQELEASPDAVADYGNSAGTGSAYSLPVSGTGTAVEYKSSLLLLDVPGAPDNVTIYLQVGPALNGTAIRDVTGLINFDQFLNQLEYQEVATELNNQVRDSVLNDLDYESLVGKEISFVGAYSRVNPELVSIVPVELEVH